MTRRRRERHAEASAAILGVIQSSLYRQRGPARIVSPPPAPRSLHRLLCLALAPAPHRAARKGKAMSDWNTSIIAESGANGGNVGGHFKGRRLLLLHTIAP